MSLGDALTRLPKTYWPIFAAAGGVSAGSAITRKLGDLSEESGQELGHTSPQRIQELLQTVKRDKGLDVGYAHVPGIIGSNAAYITRENWKTDTDHMRDSLKRNTDIHPATRKALLNRLAKTDSAMKEHGAVLTGTNYKKPGTVEHELGHAIATWKGTPAERAANNPSLTRWSPLYHQIPSALAAMAAGRYLGPVAGAGVGALTGLATGAPTLYAEHSANRYADGLIDESRPTQSRGYAYGSYLAGASAPYSIMGALAGALTRGRR